MRPVLRSRGAWHGYRFSRARSRPFMTFADDLLETILAPVPVDPPGTLWTLTHDTEGSVSVNVGPHPHGYELRLVLNQRFLRSRVHGSLADVLADAADTRERFEHLGFAELPTTTIH
jgi:hypothetical protein